MSATFAFDVPTLEMLAVLPVIDEFRIDGDDGVFLTKSIGNSTTSSAKVADTALGGAVDGDEFFCVGAYTTGFVALDANCG